MDSKKRMKKVLVGLLGLVLLLTLLSSTGNAQIPHKMNYQGYLTNAAGVPVNGTLQMVFSIYNVSSGGSPLWTETHSVTVSQGVYSVILGEGSTPNLINLPFDTTYYLGVQVGADPEMTPRKILTSVGYAFRALTVESIGSHTHSGADITSGTVSELRIDSLIARDSEVSSSISTHTAIASAHHTRYTDAEAVAAIKAADGSGSSLDADLLDGLHSTAFASSAHNHDTAYVNVTGDTMTGSLILPSNGLVAGTNQLVLSGGNVGIGFPSPSEKLHVVGNLKMGGDIKTDRWLNSDTNTFIGVGVAGAGNLSHSSEIQGWGNTAVGNYVLYSNTTGFWNSGVGSNVLFLNTEGSFNSAVGYSALDSNTTGRYNSALGTGALTANKTGNDNSAMGEEALKLNETGNRNIAVGSLAGYMNVAGSGNVFLGFSAGASETASDRLYIANSAGSTLIYGQFDTGRVCINCTDPSAGLDVNGTVRVRNQSSLWISGNGVRPYQQSDSTVINMNTTGGARITRGAAAGNKNVMLPITVTGPLFGQNVTITGLDVYWAGETEFDAIGAVLLRRQTGVNITTEYYSSILHDTSDYTCISSSNPTGCTLHYDLTTNNVLTDDSGVLYLTLELVFSGQTTKIDIGGVKLTLRHY